MVVTATQVGSVNPMSLRTLRTFFIATFVLSWGMGALLSVFAHEAEALFGPMGYTNPAFILVVYAPGIVALVLVVRHYGIRGLGRFFRRLTLWRMSATWWLLLLVGMPAVFYAGAAIKGTLGDPFPFAPWYSVLPALIPALLIGPIEELGWRGIALPLLQRRFAPLWASLILGVVVAVWHTPAFFLSGTKQSGWAIGPFFVGVVAISVILAGMFNASRGSLLGCGPVPRPDERPGLAGRSAMGHVPVRRRRGGGRAGEPQGDAVPRRRRHRRTDRQRRACHVSTARGRASATGRSSRRHGQPRA